MKCPSSSAPTAKNQWMKSDLKIQSFVFVLISKAAVAASVFAATIQKEGGVKNPPSEDGGFYSIPRGTNIPPLYIEGTFSSSKLATCRAWRWFPRYRMNNKLKEERLWTQFTR